MAAYFSLSLVRYVITKPFPFAVALVMHSAVMQSPSELPSELPSSFFSKFVVSGNSEPFVSITLSTAPYTLQCLLKFSS